MSVRLSLLALGLSLALVACDAASQNPPTIAGIPLTEDGPQPPLPGRGVEADPEGENTAPAEPSATPETTAEPADTTPPAAERPTRAGKAPTGVATAIPTETPPAVVEWSTRAPLPEANSEIAVAELDGLIYVVGGYPSSRVTVASVQRYDPAADSWTLTTPLPFPVNHAMAAAAGGKLYVVGGQSGASGGGPFLDTVFEYDPAADSWSQRASMPTARGGGAAAVVDGKIYVAGGRPPRGSDFAVHDPASDDWTELPDMPTARNHLAAAAIDGLVYVVGGRFGAGFNSEMTNVLEIYDPATNAWTAGPPMPTVRGGLNAVAANGCLHVFGGEGSGGVFAEHELYDPSAGSWLSLNPMPIPVHGVTGASFLDGLIYLPGGGTEVGGSSGSTLHQVVTAPMSC